MKIELNIFLKPLTTLRAFFLLRVTQLGTLYTRKGLKAKDKSKIKKDIDVIPQVLEKNG